MTVAVLAALAAGAVLGAYRVYQRRERAIRDQQIQNRLIEWNYQGEN